MCCRTHRTRHSLDVACYLSTWACLFAVADALFVCAPSWHAISVVAVEVPVSFRRRFEDCPSERTSSFLASVFRSILACG
ncbi:hypothetical protein BC827DRAFT_412394 [Russula dissimulans]|nr:hypothetical protein BC827DRAFT_412394 [Russula dissimulans]